MACCVRCDAEGLGEGDKGCLDGNCACHAKQDPFSCGLKGRALSYLEIYRQKGLSEGGKDAFISVLLDECLSRMDSVPKAELEDAKEVIRALRDELYDALPTGDVNAFELIVLIKKHIEQIDEAFPEDKKC